MFKGFKFPYGGLMPIRDQAYLAPIRDTIAFKNGGKVAKHMMPDGSMMLDSAMKKGGKVAKPKAKKGSAEMKARMAKLRTMKQK